MVSSFSSAGSHPMQIGRSTEAQVYGLFALAMALTCIGVFVGMQFAAVIFASGLHIVLLIAELGVVFTAGWWMRRSPLNMILFALFPLLSGITITPYLMAVLVTYANGGMILLNALLSTAAMAGAAALFARTTSMDLSVFSRALFMGLIGLIVVGILQLFIPSLRSTSMELLISGFAVVLFAVFTAVDVQRLSSSARLGGNPFLLALSLYLDIFNLFLSIVRFMVALSGSRR